MSCLACNRPPKFQYNFREFPNDWKLTMFLLYAYMAMRRHGPFCRSCPSSGRLDTGFLHRNLGLFVGVTFSEIIRWQSSSRSGFPHSFFGFPPAAYSDDDLPLRCATTLVRHNIVTSPAFKFGLNIWPSAFGAKELDIACILLGMMGTDEMWGSDSGDHIKYWKTILYIYIYKVKVSRDRPRWP